MVGSAIVILGMDAAFLISMCGGRGRVYGPQKISRLKRRWFHTHHPRHFCYSVYVLVDLHGVVAGGLDQTERMDEDGLVCPDAGV